MKLKKLFIAGIVFGMGFVLADSIGAVETIKKLHPSVQKIVVGSTFNDSNEADSSTVDLFGGTYDKASFAIYASSATGDSTVTYTLEISPDGGTTWLSTGDTIAVSTGTSAQSAHSDNLKTSPGTKLRLSPALTGSTTYYNLSIWAMPSVD